METKAGFDSRLKFYDVLWELIKQFNHHYAEGNWERAIVELENWQRQVKPYIDVDDAYKDAYLRLVSCSVEFYVRFVWNGYEWRKVCDGYDVPMNVTVNAERVYLRREIMDLLNVCSDYLFVQMHKKGMLVPVKTTGDETWDPSTFKKKSGLS